MSKRKVAADPMRFRREMAARADQVIAAKSKGKSTAMPSESDFKAPSKSGKRRRRKIFHPHSLESCCDIAGHVTNYKRYLGCDHWKALRKKKIRSVGGRCDRCKVRKKLQVHHLHYRSLGREELHDLEVVCEDCHSDIHKGRISWSTPTPLLPADPNGTEPITRQLIEAGKSARGGWTRDQLRLLGVAWPPQSGWRDAACSRLISSENAARFVAMRMIVTDQPTLFPS